MRWFFFYEFAFYIPMVLMVCVQNCVIRLPISMLIVQGWVGMVASYWVSWRLGVIGGPISRNGSNVPHCIGRLWCYYWILSLPVLYGFSDACVVSLIGIVCLFSLTKFLDPLILHCTWCVALVLITDLSICHEFLFYHSVFSVLILFLLVWLGCMFHNSGMPPVCSW